MTLHFKQRLTSLIKTKRLIFIVLILVYSFSCTCHNGDVENNEKRIDELVEQMTLKEKLGMLHGTTKFSNDGVDRLAVPALQLSDGPHGIRQEVSPDSWNPAGWTNDSASYFPTGTALAATWNPELAYNEGQALGEEARWRGKDVLLGPGVNIHRTPLCGRNFEYLSEDPFLTSVMCVPYIKGVQSKDVAACVKHYIANNQEIDRFMVNVEMSERALQEIYLPGFKAAVEQGGVYSVMGAYNKFRKVYCCENEYLLKDILRQEYGFDGIIMSDWDAVHSTRESALAGLDLEMGTNKPYNEYYFADSLLNAVQDGIISEDVVNEKVKNMLRVIMRMNMLEGERAKGSFVTREHFQAAYNVAKESIVLLKNEGKLLPINIEEIKSIAIIGDNATREHATGGYNSSSVKAKYEVTPYKGLQNRIEGKVRLNLVQGYEKTSISQEESEMMFFRDEKKEKQLIDEAVAIAKESDVAIIFAGINHDYDSEGNDKPDMALPYTQNELILKVREANPKTVVVLIGGSPIDLSEIESKIPAMLWGWYNGMEGGNAIADVLLGNVNPSGKLPFTIPVKLEDSPAHNLDAYPGKDLIVNYEEDILVGYRWFDTKEIKPMYPFGHGLSYTSFTYSELKTSKEKYKQKDVIDISCMITNSGEVDGAETVQLYVSDTECSVLRPVKELKAFKKVFLQAGESVEVQLEVKVTDLGFYDEISKGFVVEPGRFILSVASSSQDVRLTKDIEVL